MATAGLCPTCWRQLKPLGSGGCRCCGMPVAIDRAERGAPPLCERCATVRPAFSQARSAFVYEGPVRRMLLRFKHGDRLEMTPLLVRWLQAAMTPQMHQADLIAPIPIHPSRLWRRRYNQAAELARPLAACMAGATYAPSLLRRIRATPSQGHLSRAERARNVAGALAVDPKAAVSGRRVLLVDDVVTSGATLTEAARVLRAAGAARVDAITVARTLPR